MKKSLTLYNAPFLFPKDRQMYNKSWISHDNNALSDSMIIHLSAEGFLIDEDTIAYVLWVTHKGYSSLIIMVMTQKWFKGWKTYILKWNPCITIHLILRGNYIYYCNVATNIMLWQKDMSYVHWVQEYYNSGRKRYKY